MQTEISTTKTENMTTDITYEAIKNEYEALKFDDGIDSWELAELIVQDNARKGCTLSMKYHECHKCPAMQSGQECPMNDWQKIHPEYKNDELAQKIESLRKSLLK